MEKYAGFSANQIYRTFLAALKEGRKKQIRDMITGFFKRTMNKQGWSFEELLELSPRNYVYQLVGSPTSIESVDLKGYFEQLEQNYWLEKYSVWVTKLLLNYWRRFFFERRLEFRFPEDLGDLATALEVFDKKKGQLPKEQRDLNRYKNFPQFWQVVSLLIEDKSKTQLKKEGTEEIVNKGDLRIVKLTTVEAISSWCRFMDDDDNVKQLTGWCVKDPKWAAEYLAEGPLYLIYRNGEKYALAHFPSQQFLDVNDDEFPDFEQIRPALDMILQKEGLDEAWPNYQIEDLVDLSQSQSGPWFSLEKFALEHGRLNSDFKMDLIKAIVYPNKLLPDWTHYRPAEMVSVRWSDRPPEQKEFFYKEALEGFEESLSAGQLEDEYLILILMMGDDEILYGEGEKTEELAAKFLIDSVKSADEPLEYYDMLIELLTEEVFGGRKDFKLEKDLQELAEKAEDTAKWEGRQYYYDHAEKVKKIVNMYQENTR